MNSPVLELICSWDEKKNQKNNTSNIFVTWGWGFLAEAESRSFSSRFLHEFISQTDATHPVCVTSKLILPIRCSFFPKNTHHDWDTAIWSLCAVVWNSEPACVWFLDVWCYFLSECQTCFKSSRILAAGWTPVIPSYLILLAACTGFVGPQEQLSAAWW